MRIGVALCTQTCPGPWDDAWMPTRFSWFGFLLTGSLKFLIVSWKADSSDHFFMYWLLSTFSHRHVLHFVYYKTSLCRVRLKDISDLHCGMGLVDATSQISFLYSVTLALPFSPGGTEGLRGLLASFNNSTDTGKVVPRKWWVKGHWGVRGEQVLAPCFHLALTEGAEMQKTLPLRMGGVFTWAKVTWSRQGSHRSGLQTVIRCSQELRLLTVA